MEQTSVAIFEKSISEMKYGKFKTLKQMKIKYNLQ